VLLLMQPNASNVIAWHPAEPIAANRKRKACAEALAHARGAEFVVSEVVGRRGDEAMGLHPQGMVEVWDQQLSEIRILLDAAITAKRMGCTRVLSPWVVGPDHARVSRALEQSLLIVELIEPQRESAELLIDLPVVERSDVELIELALDLGAPLTSFWPCAHGSDEPCGSCAECRRWIAAFDDAGIAWPYEPAGAAG
jgi:hypothetical protein